MEWNPIQWDWENLTVLNPRSVEHDNKLFPSNFQNKHEINFGSFNSARNNSTRCPDSKLGQASRKSSKLVSVISSSLEDRRSSKFKLEGFEASLEDFGSKKKSVEVEAANTYTTLETSIFSCEPMRSLKLGKQAYFGDADNHTKPSFSMMQSKVIRKRCKSFCQNMLSPHCQVEGCCVKLSNVKAYYRKHRVCESHSKSLKVIIGGIECRFCQQCSRFHGLAEFDDKKRSCRRRLSNHNARRRKPQAKAISLNPAKLSSLEFESQQIGLFSDELSLHYPRPNANLTLGAMFSSKRSQYSKNLLKPEEACGITVELNISGNEMPCANAISYRDPSMLLPFKGAATKGLDTGEGYVVPSNLHTSRDLHYALSLLSTDLRGPSEAISPYNLNRPYNQTKPA